MENEDCYGYLTTIDPQNLTERWSETIDSILCNPNNTQLTNFYLHGTKSAYEKFPVFSVEDKDLYDVLVGIGRQVLNSPITPELVKSIKPPYPVTVVAMDSLGALDLTIPGQEHILKHEDLLAVICEDEILNTMPCISMLRLRYKEETVRKYKIPYKWIVSLNKCQSVIDLATDAPTLFAGVKSRLHESLENDHEQKVDVVTYNYERTAVAVGLFVSLNAKEVVNSEVVRPKPRLIRENGTVRQIKPNSYHKLTLTLKGKEYAEYLKEKKEGQATNRNSPRCHWCRGHFKLRKGKLYWWNAHLRSKKAKTVLAKDYIVTA